MNCFSHSYKPQNPNITVPDLNSLARITHYSVSELEGILQKYEGICEENGSISKEVILDITSATYCPLINFILDKQLEEVTSVSESLIDLPTFIVTLNIFSSRASTSEKKVFLFDLLKGSSHSPGINQSECKKLFMFMLSLNISKYQADQTFQIIWGRIADRDGRVGLDSFSKLISDYDVTALMTFDLPM
jgi:hypothetical protein